MLNRYLPPIVAVFLLLVGVVAGVSLVNNPQDVREKAAPATAIYISPASQTKTRGDVVAFSVAMNTGENLVVGMDLVIDFDPSALTVTRVSKGSAIANLDTVVKNSIDNNTGQIMYSVFTVDKTKAVNGSNLTVLDIVAQVKNTANIGTFTVSLTPSTSIAALVEGQNVVISRSVGTIDIIASNATTHTPSTMTVSPGPVLTNTPSSNNGNNAGSNRTDGTPVALGKRGDVNNDGKVNIMDLSILLSKFLKGSGSEDLNGDGKINILDLSILLSNWGK